MSRFYHLVAHLIAKLQPGICRGTGSEIDEEHAASRFVSPPCADDIAHRFSIFVRRPGQQHRASFSARGSQAHALVRESRLL